MLQFRILPAICLPAKQPLGRSALKVCPTTRDQFSAQESDRGKKTLILDLDHTLVVGSRTNRGDHDFIVEGNYHMYRRPGLEEFLRAAADHFEIVVYTAASSNYAGKLFFLYCFLLSL